jgi:hypothetical protein
MWGPIIAEFSVIETADKPEKIDYIYSGSYSHGYFRKA